MACLAAQFKSLLLFCCNHHHHIKDIFLSGRPFLLRVVFFFSSCDLFLFAISHLRYGMGWWDNYFDDFLGLVRCRKNAGVSDVMGCFCSPSSCSSQSRLLKRHHSLIEAGVVVYYYTYVVFFFAMLMTNVIY